VSGVDPRLPMIEFDLIAQLQEEVDVIRGHVLSISQKI
jgi:hypothetical protein